MTTAHPGRRRSAYGFAAMLAVATSAVGSGLAVAGSSGGPAPVPPAQYQTGQLAVLATSPSSSDLASLGILRRAHTSADQLPSDLADQVAQGAFTGSFGANVSLARRASGLSSGAAWVVPGDGSECLVANSTTNVNRGAACAVSSRVDTGGLEVETGSSRAPGAVFIAGVVPDGVTDVTLNLYGGSSRGVAVHDNVYVSDVQGAVASVDFNGPNGPVALEGVGPSTPPTAAGTPSQ